MRGSRKFWRLITVCLSVSLLQRTVAGTKSRIAPTKAELAGHLTHDLKDMSFETHRIELEYQIAVVECLYRLSLPPPYISVPPAYAASSLEIETPYSIDL